MNAVSLEVPLKVSLKISLEVDWGIEDGLTTEKASAKDALVVDKEIQFMSGIIAVLQILNK
jgi:hypothetical protein